MLFKNFGSWEKTQHFFTQIIELATPQITTNAADIKEVLIVSLKLITNSFGQSVKAQSARGRHHLVTILWSELFC